MEKVVKCNGCGQYFTREGKNIKYCPFPFCKTEYIEVGGKDNEKKEATRTQKKSFKIWGKNS